MAPSDAHETSPLMGRAEVPQRSPTTTVILKKYLSAVGIFRILAVILIVTAVLTAALWPKAPPPAAALCLTPACIHAASNYLTNLSPNYEDLDPCTDFEEYVCGGWRASHDMRADQGMVDALSLIDDTVTTTVRHILEGGYPAASAQAASADRLNFDEMQAAYDTCMDTDTIATVGMKPLVELIDGVTATLGDKDYAAAMLFLKRAGVSAFFYVDVGDDDKEPETQVISVSPIVAVGLPSKSYFADAKIVAQYEAAMAAVLGALQPRVAATASLGSPAKTAAAVVQLEAQLAAAAPDRQDLYDVTKTYNVMTVDATAALVPQFGLERMLEALVPAGYTLNTTITAFPEVLANVSRIVADTPADVVEAFLYWRVITSLSGAVLGPEVQPLRQFENVLQGKTPDAEPERWRTCVRSVGNSLGWVLSRFFVEAAFSAEAKQFGDQIIGDIKAAYLRNFAGLAWMDEEVKQVAAEKVRNIDQKIGYPTASPDILDPAALRAYYQTLNMSDDYFGNVLATRQFDEAEAWAALGQPTDMQRWGMTAATVNAYYNPPHNEIVFPAAIMQFPLFGVALPSYVSYGAFGAVAGHELSHAFDNNGRHYDVHGRYRNWWSNTTIAAFTEKAQCLVDEFGNFTVGGKDGPVHVDGQQTLGENIADSGGLTAAWSAWQTRRQEDAAPELSLPGLERFTHEQLFFVSFGNAWCSKFRPAMLTNRVATDVHSPDPVRIRGTVANSRAFREAFQCPVQEPTCELW